MSDLEDMSGEPCPSVANNYQVAKKRKMIMSE